MPGYLLNMPGFEAKLGETIKLLLLAVVSSDWPLAEIILFDLSKP